MSTILKNRAPTGPLTKQDTLIIAHHQGRISRDNLLRELERLNCSTIEAQFGGRYPVLERKRPGDIVMAADSGQVSLAGQRLG